MSVKLTNATNTSRVRVHCVDIEKRELVYSWLFEIEATKPVIQRAYRIETVAGRHTPYKFAYVNPCAQFSMIEFVSSRPGLMEVRRERQGFEANETRQVELMIPAQPEPQGKDEQEVLLYINSEGTSQISETLMFKVFVKPSSSFV